MNQLLLLSEKATELHREFNFNKITVGNYKERFLDMVSNVSKIKDFIDLYTKETSLEEWDDFLIKKYSNKKSPRVKLLKNSIYKLRKYENDIDNLESLIELFEKPINSFYINPKSNSIKPSEVYSLYTEIENEFQMLVLILKTENKIFIEEVSDSPIWYKINFDYLHLEDDSDDDDYEGVLLSRSQVKAMVSYYGGFVYKYTKHGDGGGNPMFDAILPTSVNEDEFLAKLYNIPLGEYLKNYK